MKNNLILIAVVAIAIPSANKAMNADAELLNELKENIGKIDQNVYEWPPTKNTMLNVHLALDKLYYTVLSSNNSQLQKFSNVWKVTGQQYEFSVNSHAAFLKSTLKELGKIHAQVSVSEKVFIPEIEARRKIAMQNTASAFTAVCESQRLIKKINTILEKHADQN